MGKSKILFVQGAGEGAYEEDKPLADYVRSIATDVAYPRIDGLERINWSSARKELAAALSGLEEGGTVVAHSLGGAAILKLLSEGAETPRIGALFLIATPYKAKDGEWGGDDFALDTDFADHLHDCGDIKLYHSEDDEFVPVDHVQRYGAKLPQAEVTVLDGYVVTQFFVEALPRTGRRYRTIGRQPPSTPDCRP